MLTATLPTFTAPLRFLCPERATTEPLLDLTEPADCPDLMGTTCAVHGSPRYLDEAPLIPRAGGEAIQSEIKLRHFPHSWTAIASERQPGLFDRLRRPRMVVVRYCADCRASAEAWLQRLS